MAVSTYKIVTWPRTQCKQLTDAIECTKGEWNEWKNYGGCECLECRIAWRHELTECGDAGRELC